MQRGIRSLCVLVKARQQRSSNTEWDQAQNTGGEIDGHSTTVCGTKHFVREQRFGYAPGAEGQPVSELWFADPNAQVPDATAYTEGQIVRIDPATNLVVVKTVGADGKEYEYTVDATTKYWGTDQQAFATGLRYEGFRPGARIWFHRGEGDRGRYLNEVRFYNPSAKPIIRR